MAEALARIGAPSAPAPEPLAARAKPGAGPREPYPSVAELVTPGFRREFANGVVYQNNTLGFRGPERTVEHPPNTFRIVVVGDSVTAGSGVQYDDTYAAVVEDALQRADRDRRHEVLNLGVPGLHIQAVMSRFETLGLRFHPDLVVYGCTPNDLESAPTYRRFERPMKWMEQVREQRRFAASPSYLLRALWPRWLLLREAISPPTGSYLHEIRYNFLQNDDAWDHFVFHLDRFAGAVRALGICGHVLIHPSLHHLHPLHPMRDVYERIARAAVERGLSVTDPLPRHLWHDPRSLHVGPMDPHPNATGHRLLAEALLEDLRRLPERCWVR